MGSTGAERIAFFGGSFDPPHYGHLAVARAARQALHLDRVLFAPVGAQPLKPHGAVAPFADRAEMTRLAIESEPGFELSLLDAPQESGTPNFTLDTLRLLRGHEPGARLFLILGADAFALLRNWHGAAEIPYLASLIVASRPGQEIGNLSRFLPRSITSAPAGSEPGSPLDRRAYTLRNPAGETAEFYLLPGLDVPISATEIRSHGCAAGSDAVPAAVAAYIRRHKLYQQVPRTALD